MSAVVSIYLALAVNAFASLVAMATLLSYFVFLHTPQKKNAAMYAGRSLSRRHASPDRLGRRSGKLNFEAWTLYAVLFLWQFPHFMAIAWMYRDDYNRAGFIVLPLGDARVRFVTWQTLLPLSALVAFSLLSPLAGQPSMFCCIGAWLLSLGFFYHGEQFVLHKSSSAARRLLAASIIYLPSLFVLMILFEG